MECSRRVEYRSASRSSDSWNCVQPGFHLGNDPDCGQVHVRNSRFPERVVDVPRAQWDQLVAVAQTTRRVDLTTWFPPEEYGDFAATFTEAEQEAFEHGILAREPQVTGQIA